MVYDLINNLFTTTTSSTLLQQDQNFQNSAKTLLDEAAGNKKGMY